MKTDIGLLKSLHDEGRDELAALMLSATRLGMEEETKKAVNRYAEWCRNVALRNGGSLPEFVFDTHYGTKVAMDLVAGVGGEDMAVATLIGAEFVPKKDVPKGRKKKVAKGKPLFSVRTHIRIHSIPISLWMDMVGRPAALGMEPLRIDPKVGDFRLKDGAPGYGFSQRLEGELRRATKVLSDLTSKAFDQWAELASGNAPGTIQEHNL